jgi:hypothetical protein
MIVVEHEDRRVVRIAATAHADVAWAEIAALHVVRDRRGARGGTFAVPWPILSMRGNDYPFLAKRVPSLFP